MERQITVVSVNADRVPGRLDRMCRRGQVGIGVLETEAAWSLIGELGHIGHRHADHRLGPAGPWRWHQYLLASKKLPQARHLHCIVITWLPNNEMTSVSFDRQKGQLERISLPPCGAGPSAHASGALVPGERLRRSGWGLSLGTGWHVPLLGEALQHVERQLVDPTRNDAPADRVPRLPVDE